MATRKISPCLVSNHVTKLTKWVWGLCIGTLSLIWKLACGFSFQGIGEKKNQVGRITKQLVSMWAR